MNQRLFRLQDSASEELSSIGGSGAIVGQGSHEAHIVGQGGNINEESGR